MTTMRRRVLHVAVVAVVLAVTVFGIPLAVAVQDLYYTDEKGELERLALRSAAAVSPEALTPRDVIELPRTAPPEQVSVYDAAGRRVTGAGPPVADTAVRGALHGRVSEASTATELVVAVPVSSQERVVAAARAASPRRAVQAHIGWAWAALAGLALIAGACASLVAASQARRLARPVQQLESVAAELGAGNFAARAKPSGIGELDRVGDALNTTAERLDDLLARERAFSAQASHQLRTPLTSLRLGLESALVTSGSDLRRAAEDAIGKADQLSRTIDDVLSLARGTGPATSAVDLGEILRDLRQRWNGPLAAAGRPLRVRAEDVPPAAMSAPALRQILDVLVDNALRHGSGAVTVHAHPSADAIAIDVCDEGSTTGRDLLTGAPTGAGPGGTRMGLAMATSLAEANGGRLRHARTEPRTRLTLFIPTST